MKNLLVLCLSLCSFVSISAQNAYQPAMALVPGDTFEMGAIMRITKGESKNSLSQIGMPPPPIKMGDANFEGRPDEKPHHLVQLDSFYIGKYEITMAEFKAFVDSAKYTTTAEKQGWSMTVGLRDMHQEEKKANINWQYDAKGKQVDTINYRHPVVHISWYDALHYCNWLSRMNRLEEVYLFEDGEVHPNWEANGYCLPTEAEWEFAAREGGKRIRYGNGRDTADPRQMNFDGTGRAKTPYSLLGIRRGEATAVGSFKPNRLGLYDMSGNVFEWVWDVYDADYYKNKPSPNPKGATPQNKERAVRGGYFDGPPWWQRASSRYSQLPDLPLGNIGFRVCLRLKK